MLKNNFILVVKLVVKLVDKAITMLCIVLLGMTTSMTAAWAESTLTVKEATDLQAKIARAELEAKQREIEGKGASGSTSNGRGKEIMLAPMPISARSDDLVFVGHYGIENDVKADFLLNNVLVTFSLQGKTEIGGWHIDKLTPRMARMCRTSAKRKNVGCKDIYLASELSAASTKVSNAYPDIKGGGDFVAPKAVPSLPPLPALK